MKKFICIFSLLLALILTTTGCDLEDYLSDRYDDDEEDDYYDSYYDNSYSSTTATRTYYPTPTNPTINEGPFRIKETTAPLYDGITKYAGGTMHFVVDVPAQEEDRHITVTAGDDNLIHFRFNYSYANYTEVSMDFVQAGETELTFTLEETGQSVSYRIHILEDYACNPGAGEISPQTFAECVRQVLADNGFSLMTEQTYTIGRSYKDDYELTWENARALGQGILANSWRDGFRSVYLTYQGTCPSGHKFTYYLK